MRATQFECGVRNADCGVSLVSCCAIMLVVTVFGCGAPRPEEPAVSLEEARKLLAEAEDTLDRPSLEKAQAAFAAALSRKGDPVVQQELGQTQLALAYCMAYRDSNPKAAIDYLDKAVDNLGKASQSLGTDKEKASAFARLGIAYGTKISLASGPQQQADWGLKYGRLAQLAADQAVDADPKNVLGYVAQAMMLTFMPSDRGGDPKQAVEVLKKAEQIDPRSDDVQDWFGMAYSKQGMKKEAKAAFEKALSLNPKDEFAKAQMKGMQ